jgi:hypothetical protein
MNRKVPTKSGMTVIGTDKAEFDKYCIELMNAGYLRYNYRTVTEWPFFFIRSYAADFTPPQEKPYTFSNPFTIEDGCPPDMTLQQRIKLAVTEERFEDAAALQELWNEIYSVTE